MWGGISNLSPGIIRATLQQWRVAEVEVFVIHLAVNR